MLKSKDTVHGVAMNGYDCCNKHEYQKWVMIDEISDFVKRLISFCLIIEIYASYF